MQIFCNYASTIQTLAWAVLSGYVHIGGVKFNPAGVFKWKLAFNKRILEVLEPNTLLSRNAQMLSDGGEGVLLCEHKMWFPYI